MNSTDPMSLDFAALRALCTVHSHRSFSLAARELKISQSTISYTIERLRKILGDPLFVRHGAAVVPTVRCDDVVFRARELLAQATDLFETPEADFATSTATITISTNFYERAIILPAFSRALRKAAPGIQLQVLQTSTSGHVQLKTGRSDILLSPMPNDEDGTYTRRLFSDHYVCVMDHANPLATQTLTPQLYCDASHVVVTYGEDWQSFYQIEMKRLGLTFARPMSIPSPGGLSDLLLDTEMISTIPSRITQNLPPGIVVRDCPFPAGFDLAMYWTERTHHSRLYKSVRDLVVKSVAEALPR